VEKKIIAITMGDAAGIGPEVIVKALGNPKIYDLCSPLVIGDRGVIDNTIKLLSSSLSLHAVKSINADEGRYSCGTDYGQTIKGC